MKFKSITPLEDRIVIKEIKKGDLEKTEGGIIIPDSVKKDVAEGIVVAAGAGRYAIETGAFIPNMLSKNDIVLYGRQQGMEVEIEGENGRETVRIMREGDILMLIEKAADNK